MGCASWHHPPLLDFDFDGWVSYLYSTNPSRLSSLLVGRGRHQHQHQRVASSAPAAIR